MFVGENASLIHPWVKAAVHCGVCETAELVSTNLRSWPASWLTAEKWLFTCTTSCSLSHTVETQYWCICACSATWMWSQGSENSSRNVTWYKFGPLISSIPAQFKSGELFCRTDLFLVHASPAMHEALFNVLQTFDLWHAVPDTKYLNARRLFTASSPNRRGAD